MKSRGYLFASALLVAILLFSAWWRAQAAPPAAAPSPDLSVVQIIAADEGRGGRLVPKWSGSGVLISADGLILTNCHVAMPRLIWDDRSFDYDLLIVALPAKAGRPPAPAYLAEVVQHDAGLDLALLRISQTLDGGPVDVRKLKLPFLPLGDSDALAAGDALEILGYPGTAGEPLETKTAAIAGFSTGRGVKGRAWIRTEAEIEGGLSGGPALNENGEVVGVLATGAAGSADEVVQCRYEKDTNGDGVVDQNDACTATGGAIGTLRPVNLAQPLIRAAAGGVAPEPTPAPQPKRKAPTVKASVSRLIFAPEIDEYEQPATVVETLPSGTEAIYLFFDYDNFEDGATWQPQLVVDGKPQKNAWPAARWDGGAHGTAYISLGDEGEPLDDGTYEFIITYEGAQLGSATIEVGGRAEKRPTFSYIVFSAGGEEGYLLPGGINEIEATFEYANMTRNTQWSYVSYYEGEEIGRGKGTPFTRASGSTSLPLHSESALAPGVYRLELYIEDRLAATADCLVGEGEKKAGGTFFGPITFAEGVDRKGNPIRPGTTFKSGISELYGIFEYQGMQDGWEWGWQWTVNGESLPLQKRSWEEGESGWNTIQIYNSKGALPDGEYQLDLYVKGKMVQSGTCAIGGQTRAKPTPTPKRPTPREGVEVYGRITDAETGRGIPGAYFVVLKPGIKLADFEGKQEQVYTAAETDRNGDFRLPDPLIRGKTYSMFAVAEGYRPIGGDDIRVGEDVKSPLELNLELKRAR